MTDSGSEAWVARFFADADRTDIDILATWFADNIDLRFGNAPPLHGKAAAAEALAGFFGTIAGMRHEALALVAEPDAAAQQAIVHYERADGTIVSLPVSSYLRRTGDGLLDRLWIHIDIAPLYSAAA